MCLLAVLFRVTDDAPLVVGANREEAFERGGTGPDLREGPARFIAGLDPVAGGTWLGVNRQGVLVAVTNRPRGPAPKAPRSRGLLVRDLLACASAREARDRAVEELAHAEYAGCNLLLADTDNAIVIHHAEWLRVAMLPAGAHVLTQGDVNAEGDPRARFAMERLRSRDYENASDALAEMRRVCSHAGPPTPIVVRGKESGTVSSTLLAVRSPLKRSELYHAQGSPDRSPYQDVSHLFARLARG